MSEAKMSTVQVKLVQCLQLSPHQSAIVQVRVDGYGDARAVCMEHEPHLGDDTGVLLDG